MKLVIVVGFLLNFLSFTNENSDLTIQVNHLRNNTGVIQFTLYNKDGSIPDKGFKKYFKIGKTSIENQSATYTFKGVPKGKYAVNILHDENTNGKIDIGFILPEEGIGFSNYTKIGLGNKPNFQKASFNLKENKFINIKVIYHTTRHL